MDKAQLISALQEAVEDKNLSEWSVLAEKALTEFPNEAFSNYYKGEYLLSLNDTENAIPFLKKAVDILPDFENQLSLGLAKLQANLDEEAKVIFDSILVSNPNSSDLNYAYALYFLGNSDEEKALEKLNNALTTDPNHINALDLRAYLHRNLNNDEEALEDLNKLLSVDPKSVPWRFQRIELLKNLDERESVEEDFRFLIELHPIDIDFRISFGDYYMNISEYQEAIYCFSDALDIERRGGFSTSHPYKKRAEAQYRKGDYYKAAEDFKHAMKIDEEDPDVYLGLADVYISLQKLDMAINYLEIGLDAVFDARWRLYQKLGELALDLKKYDEAEDAFKNMTRETQGQAEGFYQLGILYLRQGDLETAYKALKEADENLHDMAADMIEAHCAELLKNDSRIQEKELQAEYEDEIVNNAKSPLLSKIFGKFWKMDEKATTENNVVLSAVPTEMKDQLLKVFKAMIFKITPNGFLIFIPGKEDTRALYSILSEEGNTIEIEALPFGRSSSNEMTINVSDNSVGLCGIGAGDNKLNLYFKPAVFTEMPEAIQKNFKEKEAKGDLEFLG